MKKLLSLLLSLALLLSLTACGDHEAYYTVPALEGGAVSELTIETMSGEVTIGASSSGSN